MNFWIKYIFIFELLAFIRIWNVLFNCKCSFASIINIFVRSIFYPQEYFIHIVFFFLKSSYSYNKPNHIIWKLFILELRITYSKVRSTHIRSSFVPRCPGIIRMSLVLSCQIRDAQIVVEAVTYTSENRIHVRIFTK